MCVVGESSGDLLAGGVCSRGRHSARARPSACRFVSASVIVRDLQTQAERQSAAVHFSVLSCKMDITVYQCPEYQAEPLWPVIQRLLLGSQLLVFITAVPMIFIDFAATVAYVLAFRKFPIWGSCETFPWNDAHKSGKRAGTDGISGCSADKETIHLLSDHFSHDRELQISQIRLRFQCSVVRQEEMGCINE